MPIPQVRVISKQVIARPVQANSTSTGLLLIQAERGPTVPTLIANMSDFTSKYTQTGDIPMTATNRSAYYTAQNFLRASRGLWVRRVVPSIGANYADAVFQQEPADIKTVAISTLSNDIFESAGNVGTNGDCVTVFGSDLPTGLINGQKYFLGQDGTDVTFYATETDGALSDQVTGMSGGSGTIYLMASELPEAGLDTPDSLAITDPLAFALYATDQGDWGNKVYITVEVPRLNETDIHCTDQVDASAGTFPVTESWLESNSPGLPIHLLPISTAVLPTTSRNVALSALTPYYALSTDAGTRIKLAISLANSIAPTTLAFDGSDGSVGSGQVLASLVGSMAYVGSTEGVDYTIGSGSSKLKTTYISSSNTMDIPCSTPMACVLVGSSLPSPLQQGVIYWAYRDSNMTGDNYHIKLSSSYNEAATGSSTGGIAILSGSYSAFNIMFFPTEQTINRSSGVTDSSSCIVNCNTIAANAIAISDAFYGLIANDEVITVLTSTISSSDLTTVGLTAGSSYYIKAKSGSSGSYKITLYSDTDLKTVLTLSSHAGYACLVHPTYATSAVAVVACTAVETDGGIILSSSLYGDLTDGDCVYFSPMAASVLPTGLPTGITANHFYYVTKPPAESGEYEITISDSYNGSAITLVAGTGTMLVGVVSTSYIVSNQNIETGTPVELSGTGLPLIHNDTQLTASTKYYAVNVATTSANFKVKLALSQADAMCPIGGRTVSFVGNSGVTGSFNIIPVNVYDLWSANTSAIADSTDTIDLDGAVYFGGVSGDSTIQLQRHDGAYQKWIPGEPIRIYPSGAGSVLPYGLSSSATYFILPLDDSGKVQICTKSGGVLTSASQLIPVKLSTTANKKGSGYLRIISGNSPLADGTFRINVYKQTTQSSSIAGQFATVTSLEEQHVCSLYSNVQDVAGRSLELENKLRASKYIRGVGVDATSNANIKIKAVPVLTPLAGGSSGANSGLITSSDLIAALPEFSDTNQYSLSYLLDGGYTYPEYQVALISLATQREDCIAVLSTPVELEAEANPAPAIVDYVNNNIPSSSFGAVYTPWQLSSQNDVAILVPPDGFAAAQMAIIDSTLGPWAAAAGLENGGILSNGGSTLFTQVDLDDLADNRINPIIRISGAGPTIWGNSTLLAVQSPLSQINVRKLMNKLQKDLRRSLLQFVMAPITTQTYTSITNLCTSYLGSIVAKGGIENFMVVCDSSNNSAEDRDSQTINVWIYVKPVEVAKFIDLTTVVTPSSVSFTTLAG